MAKITLSDIINKSDAVLAMFKSLYSVDNSAYDGVVEHCAEDDYFYFVVDKNAKTGKVECVRLVLFYPDEHNFNLKIGDDCEVVSAHCSSDFPETPENQTNNEGCQTNN